MTAEEKCRTRKCKHCIYKSTGRGGTITCDYIGYTGHARLLICPPGDACTVFQDASEVENPAKNAFKTTEGLSDTSKKEAQKKYEERVAEVRKKAMECYEKGMSDDDIAKEVGRSLVWVCKWRTQMRLPKLGRDSKFLKRQKMRSDIERLYKEGHTDTDISEQLKCSRVSVKKWREEHGLPPNKKG